MTPPSKDDLVGPDPIGLDEREILKHFLGMTEDQFLERLRSTPGTYQEDFMWMAEPGLRHYLPVVFAWLQEVGTNSWEMSHGLLCSLSFQIEYNKLQGDVVKLINDIADYIDHNRDKFDVGTDDLLGQYLETIRKMSRTTRSTRTQLRGT